MSKIGWVFGILKNNNIDTKGMSPGEAFQTLEDLRQQEKKEYATQKANKKLTDDKNVSTIKGCKRKLSAFKGKDEGTYDLETGESVNYESGYQVSFQQTSDNYTEDQFDEKVAELARRTGTNADAGIFDDNPEVSFHVENLKQSMEIAVEYNQHSVWDWKRGRIIKNLKFNVSTNKVDKE